MTCDDVYSLQLVIDEQLGTHHDETESVDATAQTGDHPENSAKFRDSAHQEYQLL